jgi:hypothetical protein
MENDGRYDSTKWHDEPGASTGDLRENNPATPGFTDDRDRVFRSLFQHANRETSRDLERPEQVEVEAENGWLNVRVGNGEWASAPETPSGMSDPAQQGRVQGLPPAGTTPSHDRVSFNDPVPGNIDPTDPDSPESAESDSSPSS